MFAGADAENTARLAALENGDAEVGFAFPLRATEFMPVRWQRLPSRHCRSSSDRQPDGICRPLSCYVAPC